MCAHPYTAFFATMQTDIYCQNFKKEMHVESFILPKRVVMESHEWTTPKRCWWVTTVSDVQLYQVGTCDEVVWNAAPIQKYQPTNCETH